MVQDPDWSDDGNFGGDLDPTSQEAVTWFAAMHADQVSSGERASFRAWMRRDMRHRAAYADIERLWSGAADLPAVKARRRAARHRMTRRGFGAAAIAAAVGGSAWMISREHPFADYRTATGERRTITLPDASTVDLAGASALSVNFQPGLRLATLYAGEAFFSVAPDMARPFAVDAGAGRTLAAGTAFNINYISDGDVEVTVAEHAVDVQVAAQEVRLTRGNQVAYGRGAIGAPAKVDSASVTAWREGRLIFVSAPFGRVVSALNRWRHGRLMIMSGNLSARPVTLIVDLKRSGDILQVLEQALPIRVVNITPYLTLLFEA